MITIHELCLLFAALSIGASKRNNEPEGDNTSPPCKRGKKEKRKGRTARRRAARPANEDTVRLVPSTFLKMGRFWRHHLHDYQGKFEEVPFKPRNLIQHTAYIMLHHSRPLLDTVAEYVKHMDEPRRHQKNNFFLKCAFEYEEGYEPLCLLLLYGSNYGGNEITSLGTCIKCQEPIPIERLCFYCTMVGRLGYSNGAAFESVRCDRESHQNRLRTSECVGSCDLPQRIPDFIRSAKDWENFMNILRYPILEEDRRYIEEDRGWEFLRRAVPLLGPEQEEPWDLDEAPSYLSYLNYLRSQR